MSSNHVDLPLPGSAAPARSNRGRWIVVAMFAFASTATGLMYLYWKLHVAPFLPLQKALAQEFRGSRPRVEGGQRKIHQGTPKILRVTLKVDFDPQADEPRAAAFAGRLSDFVRRHEDLSRWERLEIHLYFPRPEKQIVEWTRTEPTEPLLRLATFRTDVTPPIGDGPCVGCMPKVESVEHPLELRGVVLSAGDRTFVVAAIDFCGICNESDEAIRDAMARAAGTTRDRVAMQSLHQHSAPILDIDAVRLLHGDDGDAVKRHLRFSERVASDAAKAIDAALERRTPVTRVVCSKAKVDRVASNRRVPQADGTIAVRASLTRDEAVREAPEGLIDPWLRTLTFHAADRPLAQLHYYATHPQTFYGDGRVSWDCVGMARERFEKETGTFQIYFTGCGGNVTVGRYNDGTRAARERLTGRLLDAMRRSATPEAAARSIDVAALKPDDVRWDTAPIRFTVREDGAFHPETLRRQLDAAQPFATRLTAAMFSGFLNRLRNGHVGQAARLRVGPLDVLHLPGEPFVEFQRHAQQVAAKAPVDAFVCVAGYGECGVWYYGPDTIFTDRGGYEQTWSVTGPCQKTVEDAIDRLLTR